MSGGDLLERITIGLGSPAIAWLRKEAKKRGISIGELLRRIVDQARDAAS